MFSLLLRMKCSILRFDIRKQGILACKAYNLLSQGGFFSYFYIGNKHFTGRHNFAKFLEMRSSEAELYITDMQGKSEDFCPIVNKL